MTTKSQPRAAGEAAHTPTPWAIRHGSHYDYIHAPIDNGGGIGRFVAKLPDDEQGKRDAAFIVRACNSHAALVAALEAVADYAVALDFERNGHQVNAPECIQLARAALAQAKEGQP